MTRRRVRITILCEDRQHEVFAMRYLVEKGFDKRSIRPKPAPAGKGSGEQFVRKHYAREVKEHRRIATYRSAAALVTVIDADTGTVDTRHRQLNAELKKKRLSPRDNRERIVLLIPKRNIETWIHYLRRPNEYVDESETYEKLPRPSECGPAVQKMVSLCAKQPDLPENFLPSLRRGCKELRRLT